MTSPLVYCKHEIMAIACHWCKNDGSEIDPTTHVKRAMYRSQCANPDCSVTIMPGEPIHHLAGTGWVCDGCGG